MATKKSIKEQQASIREANAIRRGGGPARAAWEKNLAKAKVQQSALLADRARKDAAKAPAGGPEKPPPEPPAWFKMPKTLGACADALFKYRAERLELGRKVDEFAGAELALKNHLIEQLPKSDAGGIAGKLARVSVKSKPIPVVKDWDAFYAGIVRDYMLHAKKKDGLQTGAFALLNRALNKGTAEEHWKSGAEVPGVGTFNATTVSVEKL